MMTKKQFDEFIKQPHTVSKKVYEENKELFDEAEQQERIRISKNSSQITAGNIKYPQTESYHIEPLN